MSKGYDYKNINGIQRYNNTISDAWWMWRIEEMEEPSDPETPVKNQEIKMIE